MMTSPKIYYPELVSTITWMHNELKFKDLPHGTCVYTDSQTGGRGQGSNTWESERGENVMFAILLRPEKVAVSEQFIISEIVALSIAEVLENYLQTDVRIKWPNDIYVGDRKICGILIENQLRGNDIRTSIIGAGINVNQKTFLSDAPNPVSMTQLTGETYNKEEILDKVASIILEKYEDLDIDSMPVLQRQYFSKLYRNINFHTFKLPDGTLFDAKMVEVLPTGHLVLKNKQGQNLTFAFKEVQFVL